jgi:hypothetical protein
MGVVNVSTEDLSRLNGSEHIKAGCMACCYSLGGRRLDLGNFAYLNILASVILETQLFIESHFLQDFPDTWS